MKLIYGLCININSYKTFKKLPLKVTFLPNIDIYGVTRCLFLAIVPVTINQNRLYVKHSSRSFNLKSNVCFNNMYEKTQHLY